MCSYNKNVELLNTLRSFIRGYFQEKKYKSFEPKNSLEIEKLESKQYYDLLVEKISGYTYNETNKEDLEIILNHSLERLVNFFRFDSYISDKLDEYMKLDISDLFLILEIVDDEMSITNTTDNYCMLFKNNITGKYECNRKKEVITHDIAKITSLIRELHLNFNSFNIYLENRGSNKNEKLDLNDSLHRFSKSDETYKIKPAMVVNRIHLNQIEIENQISQVRCWELMLYYKIIGIVGTLFLLCDDSLHFALANNASNQSCSNEKLCMALISGVVNTLAIFQHSDYLSNHQGSMICLQNELYDILRNKFPYNLSHCLNDAYHWSYFEEYLNTFCKIQILIIREISRLLKKTDNIFNNQYFNASLGLVDFIFNRIFILIDSIEIKYYSDDENNTNYISSLYILITNYFYSLLLINKESEHFFRLNTIIVEVNLVNWVKLSFSCMNNIHNTSSNTLQIAVSSLIPNKISNIGHFQGKSFNGYVVIYYGLRILHQLLQIPNIDIFLPLVKHIFDNLNIIHYLFSVQITKKISSVTLDEFLKTKNLLDEVTILFAEQISEETIELLCSSENSIKNIQVESCPIYMLLKKGCHII